MGTVPYMYRCSVHGDYRTEYEMGQAPKKERCPKCGITTRRVIVATYNSINALETKMVQARKEQFADAKFAADHPAYRRLRKNGIQPRGINGSAELEGRASTQFEVEYGRIFKKEDLPKVKEGLELGAEIKELHKEQGLIRELQ